MDILNCADEQTLPTSEHLRGAGSSSQLVDLLNAGVLGLTLDRAHAAIPVTFCPPEARRSLSIVHPPELLLRVPSVPTEASSCHTHRGHTAV